MKQEIMLLGPDWPWSPSYVRDMIKVAARGASEATSHPVRALAA